MARRDEERQGHGPDPQERAAGGETERDEARDARDAASPDDGAATVEDDGGAAADALGEMKDKWLRAKAELENVRRAARLETDQARRYGAGPVILSLLSVLDNLQRALAAPPEALDADYLEGLRLIERQFLDALAVHGVTPVPAERGTPLDPSRHRALMEQDSDDVAPGCILLVAVPGYMLHDRLLREAQVVVARAPAPAEA